MVFSVPVVQQQMMIMMMSLFSLMKLCMSQNATECASEHLKFLGGCMPPDPPTVNDCRTCSLLQLPPKWKKLCTALFCRKTFHAVAI